MKRRRLSAVVVAACAFSLVVPGSATGAPATPSATWTVLPLQGEPPFRYESGVSYSPTSKHVLMFGGFDANGMGLADTWIWNGVRWKQLDPATSPPARGAAVMAWDGHHVILFGGSSQDGGSSWYDDTWMWAKGDWTQVDQTGTHPVSRSLAAAGWDGTHLVLYGGWHPNAPGADGAGDFGDTWEWRPVVGDWHELAVSGPGVRRQAVATYSKSAGGLLLYGGTTGQFFMNDTWVLQSDGWHQLTTNCSVAGCPPPPYGGALASDAGLALLAASSRRGIEQVWEWIGSWQRVSTNDIGGRLGAGLTWFPPKHEGLLVCGASPREHRRASATLRWVSRT